VRESQSTETAEHLAEERGVSRATVERAAQFAAAVDTIAAVAPEARQRILDEETGLSRKDIKKIAALPALDRTVRSVSQLTDLLNKAQHLYAIHHAHCPDLAAACRIHAR
jgi:hypothetical protein